MTLSQKPTFDKYAKMGLLKSQTEGPLTIYGYNEFTQYEQLWNNVTMSARGIVFDNKDRLIIRPLTKFFNKGERWGDMIDSFYGGQGQLTVQMKYDGSMISVADDPEHGLVVTSKMSFISDHANWAKEIIKENGLVFEPGITYCFELLHPENINYIVVRADTKDLVLFAAVDNESGKELDIYSNRFSSFTRAEVLPPEVLQDINSLGFVEGVVVNYGTHRLKYKTEQFLKLHRIIGDLTEKRVWELLSSGEKMDRSLLPEEHLDWLDGVEKSLFYEFQTLLEKAFLAHEKTKHWTDREIGQSDLELKSMVFNLRRGMNISKDVWKQIKPKGK